MKVVGIERLIENIGGYECRVCGGQHKDVNQFIVGEDGYLRCGYCGEVIGEEITRERCPKCKSEIDFDRVWTVQYMSCPHCNTRLEIHPPKRFGELYRVWEVE